MSGSRTTINALLAAARRRLARLEPTEAVAAVREGAVIIDIRSERDRERDGMILGARCIPRNVLEWRLDPASGHNDPQLSNALDRHLILVCNEGYQSSLAAATLQDLGSLVPPISSAGSMPGVSPRSRSSRSPLPTCLPTGCHPAATRCTTIAPDD